MNKTFARQRNKGYFANQSVTRDCEGILKLPQIQLIRPYKISCIEGSSEIPIMSLSVTQLQLQKEQMNQHHDGSSKEK